MYYLLHRFGKSQSECWNRKGFFWSPSGPCLSSTMNSTQLSAASRLEVTSHLIITSRLVTMMLEFKPAGQRYSCTVTCSSGALPPPSQESSWPRAACSTTAWWREWRWNRHEHPRTWETLRPVAETHGKAEAGGNKVYLIGREKKSTVHLLSLAATGRRKVFIHIANFLFIYM